MDLVVPTSQVALAVLLLAIAPGYITVAAWGRARTWKGPSSDLRTIIQALVLSAVVQAILSPLTVFWILPIRAEWSSHPWRITIWIVLSVIVLPVVLGLGSARLTDKLFPPSQLFVSGSLLEWLNRIAPAPTAPTVWDWFYLAERSPKSGFMVVGFDDGSRVAGAFAQESMALTSPEVHGIFFEEEWILDENGNIFGELPGTSGILIPTIDNVRWVRILKSGEDAEKERSNGKESRLYATRRSRNIEEGSSSWARSAT